jgi:hypothetical protein
MKKRSNRAVAVLSSLAMLLGLSFAIGASGASADDNTCWAGDTCWWVNTNYAGTYYASSKDQLTWPSGIQNKDKSVWNDGTSGQAVHVYRVNGQIDEVYCVKKGSKKTIPSGERDYGSSHEWTNATSGCL